MSGDVKVQQGPAKPLWPDVNTPRIQIRFVGHRVVPKSRPTLPQLSQSHFVSSMWLCGQTDVAWQLPNWIRLNLACRPITSYRIIQRVPYLLILLASRSARRRPFCNPKAGGKENAHDAGQREHGQNPRQGFPQMRCYICYIYFANSRCMQSWHKSVIRLNESKWQHLFHIFHIYIFFICFIANGLPEVHAGLTRFIPILMRLSGLVSRLCRLQAACKL